MPLTTTTRVELYLGIDLDSSQETEMALIIESVQLLIESYCNRKFDNDIYYHQRLGAGEREIILPNIPINEVKWMAMGTDVLLSITYGGTKAASIEIEDQELRLSENLTTTTIDLEDSLITDIDSLVTAIGLVANWSATAASGYGSYPALVLNPIVRCPVDDDSNYEIDLSGSASWLKAYREVEGLYVSDRLIPAGMPYTVIYDGGYTTAPADLSQLATEMAAAIWRYNVQHGGGVLKREDIGDYSWVLSDMVGKTGGILFSYKDRLDQYARLEL